MCYSVVSSPYLLWQIHSEVWRTTSTQLGKSRQHFSLMGKKHKNLFSQIIEPGNLLKAYHKAAKGKRYTAGHLVFQQHLGANLAALREALLSGTYQPGEPVMFWVFEPKRREITAMPFVDRVAQHALCNVIEPIFDQVFLPQSHACRTGKGTHSAAAAVQSQLRRVVADGGQPWVLKTDFSKYFYSVKRDLLHAEFARKIACYRTLDLLGRMVPASGVGLPIGNLTSQISANLYGHIMDRWLVHSVGINSFVRYMDDIVVISRQRESLDVLRHGMEWFADARMGLRFSRWSVQPATRGVNFVGYRIWSTHKLLRRDSVLRARKKICKYTKSGNAVRLRDFLAAWRGHARRADSHNLLTSLGVT
jgi:RNA-directed DNA polymerase